MKKIRKKIKTHPQKKWMGLAIQSAQRGMKRLEGGPFGACIVKGNCLIALAHNTVLKDQNATSHAEINAIRIASKKLGRFDLKGCILYSTTEPCPMCFSAIHWARVDQLVFGTTIRDVASRGFNELGIPNAWMKKKGKSSLRLKPGFMRAPCLKVLQTWDRQRIKIIY